MRCSLLQLQLRRPPRAKTQPQVVRHPYLPTHLVHLRSRTLPHLWAVDSPVRLHTHSGGVVDVDVIEDDRNTHNVLVVEADTPHTLHTSEEVEEHAHVVEAEADHTTDDA